MFIKINYFLKVLLYRYNVSATEINITIIRLISQHLFELFSPL
jgi:hypothetical protein